MYAYLDASGNVLSVSKVSRTIGELKPPQNTTVVTVISNAPSEVRPKTDHPAYGDYHQKVSGDGSQIGDYNLISFTPTKPTTEVVLGDPMGYGAHAKIRDSDGVQFVRIDLPDSVELYGIAVFIHKVPSNGVQLEVAVYADSGGLPAGAKLATTGLVTEASLAKGRQTLLFTTPFVSTFDAVWVSISNLDSGKLELVSTLGKYIAGVYSGRVYFDKVASGPAQADPIVSGDLSTPDESIVLTVLLTR